MNKENVMVCLSGKYTSHDNYIKNYLYSLGRQKLLKPNRIEKTDTDKQYSDRWEEVYYLLPGKYLIIEINFDDIEHRFVCKKLKVFAIDDYLSEMKEKSPNVDIKEFKSLYHYGGWKFEEWVGSIPDWVELPSDCLYGEDDKQKRINYIQPKEVEDKLRSLLPTDNDEQFRSNLRSNFLINKKK